MTPADLLAEAFARIRDLVHSVVEDLTPDQLTRRPAGGANSIAWLVWHLTRIQDDHVTDVAGGEQVWTSGGWAERFDLPFEPSDTGYGHTAEQVGEVRVDDASLLTGYHDAVFARTEKYVGTIVEQDLDHVVDERWDPPVTLGVRLVSVIADDLQHAGQAAYAKGLLQR